MSVRDELYEKIQYIYVPFWKKFLCGCLDILFFVAINIPMFLVICKLTNGTKDGESPTLSNLVPKPVTMLSFSLYMLFNSILFFTILPLYFSPQTMFSKLFRIKAITIDGGEPTALNWFKANFVVIYMTIIVNIIFFSFACVENVEVKYLNLITTTKDLWKIPIKIIFIGLVMIQVHYFFTVALIKKRINWFNEYTGIVYVDVVKMKVFENEIFAEQKDPLKVDEFGEPLYDLPGLDEEETMEEDVDDFEDEEELELDDEIDIDEELDDLDEDGELLDEDLDDEEQDEELSDEDEEVDLDSEEFDEEGEEETEDLEENIEDDDDDLKAIDEEIKNLEESDDVEDALDTEDLEDDEVLEEKPKGFKRFSKMFGKK